MQEHWTIEDYRKYQGSKGKKSKYGAKKTKIDGYTFDSQKEAEFYSDLKFKTMAGEIAGFCLQPIFILTPELKYKADFIVFNNDGSFEIVDVKGFQTKEYTVKKKVLEDKYNLKITEV